MRYRVEFTPEAARQLRALRAADRAAIADQCVRRLSTNPLAESRAGIKRLRGGVFPPFRLRVHEYRVFYDVEVDAAVVVVYGVVGKAEASAWLTGVQEGSQHEDGDAE